MSKTPFTAPSAFPIGLRGCKHNARICRTNPNSESKGDFKVTSNPKEYVLFTAPNTCARVPTIALEEIGLPFQTRLIRFMRNEHTSESFRAINPKGRVPALLCNGQALTENVAILRFLARRHPCAKLLPSVSSDLDDARQIADLCYCATLHPIVTGLYSDVRRRCNSPPTFTGGRRCYDGAFTLVERRLSESVSGGTGRLVDHGCAYLIGAGSVTGEDPTPPCSSRQRIAERPSVQRTATRSKRMRYFGPRPTIRLHFAAHSSDRIDD